MRTHVTRLSLAVISLLVVVLAAGVIARAVSRSDVAYYDGFQDLSGLDMAQSQGVQIDALGGLRMATNGTATPASWTSTADFTSPAAPLGPLVGQSTLDASTVGGTLRLPAAPFAFRSAQDDPVLEPVDPLSVDGYGVGGMSVQRVGTTYYMWYSGVPENEYSQRIYLATSSDGITWTKEPNPVLGLGAPGAFDSRQLTKPSVIYDPANVVAPFRMWYAAEDESGGGVGYATSSDGRTWTKLGEVLAPGKPGMADSYRVMQPCVLVDNGVYFMWYTADDSNNRRVAYSTSTDGLAWARGGVVFDVGTGNYSEGAFAPAVVRTASGFHMLFTGNKIVAGSDIQSKLINADSSDGLTWAAGNIAFSASGSGTAFDGYNVSQPTILSDPADASHPCKMWYVGNNPDANGNYHDRIGLAYQKNRSTVSQWVKVAGPAGAPYYESVLTLGTQGTVFDSMKVADLRPVAKPAAAGAGLYGFYGGTNAADFMSRIGVKQSADGGFTWTDVGTHATLIDVGPGGAFDAGGVACPAPLANGVDTGWRVYHTSLSAAGVPSIGLHTVSADLGTVTRTVTPVLTSGGPFDSAGQADPSAVASGSRITLFYAGKDASGGWSIGSATTTTATPATFSSAHQILAPTAGTYDAGGLRHPVAHLAGDGTWRLFYTAIGSDSVKRIAFATAPADLSTWTKRGLVRNPSTDAYDFAEAGVEPSFAASIGATGESLLFTGTDRFGWTRIGKVTAGGSGFVAGGSVTYELDGGGTRDWRRILWAPATIPAGTTREVWVSYSPTLSGGWSDAYQVTNATDLPFLLTVQKMRWQVRMTSDSASATPALEQLTVNHAPVHFPTTATAVTQPLGPPHGLYVLTWGDLIVSCDVPAGTGVTVEVRDDAGAQVVAPQPVVGTSLTIPLTAVAPLGGKLVAVCTLAGDGATTPKIKNLTATYTTTSTPSNMSLTAARTLLRYGASTVLSGKLVSDPTPLDATDGNTLPLAGQTVTIRQHVPGTIGYTEVATAVTAADGAYSLSVKPAATTTYRAVWAGGKVATVVYPPASAIATVQVKPKITLALNKYNSKSGKYFRYRLGRRVYAKGTLKPNHAKLGDGTTPGTVTVTAYRYKKSTHKWVKVKRALRSLTTTSTYRWSWRPRARGTYRLATTFAGDVDHAAGASRFRYVRVY